MHSTVSFVRASKRGPAPALRSKRTTSPNTVFPLVIAVTSRRRSAYRARKGIPTDRVRPRTKNAGRSRFSKRTAEPSSGGSFSTPMAFAASPNAGQLACFAEDDDRVSDRHGRLGPGAMVGAFELVAAHLAFHRAWVGTQPPLGDPLGEDLGDRPPGGSGDLVRGKTPRGSPGDGARSASCPQTTAGRGPRPRPGRPGASACGSRSGPAGAPRPPAPHPRDAWSAAPPARRAGGSSTHPARPRPPSAGGTARPAPPRVPGRGQGWW